MKNLTFLMLVLFTRGANAQVNNSPSTYRSYRLPNVSSYSNVSSTAPGDTSFADSVGTVRLTDQALIIDGRSYLVTERWPVTFDDENFYWQQLTLDGITPCLLRRYPNYALMNIIIQPDIVTSWCYYIR